MTCVAWRNRLLGRSVCIPLLALALVGGAFQPMALAQDASTPSDVEYSVQLGRIWGELVDDSETKLDDWPVDLDLKWARLGASRMPAALDLLNLPETKTDESFVITCSVRDQKGVGVEDRPRMVCALRVYDADGQPLFEGQSHLSLTGDSTPCHFVWDVQDLPDGVYLARASLVSMDARELGFREFFVRKISEKGLSDKVLKALEETRQLTEHIDGLEQRDLTVSPETKLRMAIVEDCATKLAAPLDEVSWRQTLHWVRYISRTAAAIRARLALAQEAESDVPDYPAPDMSQIKISNGALTYKDRPVFLFGAALGHDHIEEDLARLKRYGLNLAKFEISPRDTLVSKGGPQDIEKLVQQWGQAAKRHNIALTCSLVPASLPRKLVAEWPDMMIDGVVNLAHDEAALVAKRHASLVAPYLVEQEMICSVSIADEPALQFRGDDVQKGFVEYVRNLYENRSILNRVWQSRYSTFDEVKIDDRRKRLAYRRDWLSYHQDLGTALFKDLCAIMQDSAGAPAVHIEFSDELFRPGAARNGIDHDALLHLFEVNACAVANSPESDVHALEYPRQTMVYSLLRSMALDKPVMNLEDRFIPTGRSSTSRSFDFVHTLMWEGAIAGLSASAVPLWDEGLGSGILNYPECLEAYGTSCIQLNRLSPIVAAFQQAPATVGILWSSASRMLDETDSYLKSVMGAYEGCSFGGGKVAFITEEACTDETLANLEVLAIPKTLAAPKEVLGAVTRYIENGGRVIRTGNTILYDVHGLSHGSVLPVSDYTILLPEQDRPTEYLHALDAMSSTGSEKAFPGAINRHGYPLEGVKTQWVEHDGHQYMYIVNLRKETTTCHIRGREVAGRDLIGGGRVVFPLALESLRPMLIKVDGSSSAEGQDSGELLKEGHVEDGEIPTVHLKPVEPS